MSDYSPQERISQKPSSDDAEKKSRKGLIIAIICILLLIAAIIALILFLKPKKDEPEPEKQHSRVVTPDNVEEILKQVKESKKNLETFDVVMNSTWTFEDGKSPSSNAYVENSVYNSDPYYFDIVRSDTGETIYSSPIIPVGSHLEDIVLDTELSKGTYECVLAYNTVDDEQNVLDTVKVHLTIIVSN